MSTRRSKKKPIDRSMLSDKQKRILGKVYAKTRTSMERYNEAEQRHLYIRTCVDSRICPKCGGPLTYNNNHQWFNWLITSCGKKSNCICGKCGYMYEFGHSNGLGPGKPC